MRLLESFPSETVARIFDSLFANGFKVWHRVAVSQILKCEKEILMSQSLPEVAGCIRAVGTQRRRRRSHGKSVCAEEFSWREDRTVAQKSRPKIRPGKRAEVQYYERRMRQKVMRARDLLSRVIRCAILVVVSFYL